MSEQEIRETVSAACYRDWQFHVGSMGDGFFLQVRFLADDADTGQPRWQHGRKWYLSRHSVGDEVVKTAWLAVLTALEHEAREAFRYRGETVFNPHTSVDALAELQRWGSVVTRNRAAE